MQELLYMSDEFVKVFSCFFYFIVTVLGIGVAYIFVRVVEGFKKRNSFRIFKTRS